MRLEHKSCTIPSLAPPHLSSCPVYWTASSQWPEEMGKMASAHPRPPATGLGLPRRGLRVPRSYCGFVPRARPPPLPALPPSLLAVTSGRCCSNRPAVRPAAGPGWAGLASGSPPTPTLRHALPFCESSPSLTNNAQKVCNERLLLRGRRKGQALHLGPYVLGIQITTGKLKCNAICGGGGGSSNTGNCYPFLSREFLG